MNRIGWGLALLLASASMPASAADDASEGYRETLQALTRARAIQPQAISPELNIYRLSGGLWAHRSYFAFGDQRLHANGMILIGEERITVIDAPWTPAAANDLLDWLDSTYPTLPKRLVVTHAHDDRMGGIAPFIERMIPVYSQRNTAPIARGKGWAAPNFLFDASLLLRSDDRAIELFYPGPAHTIDNIIVWFPEEKVLFGGCMVKSVHSGSLGYTGDADVRAWPDSLRRALERYPEAQTVIPGHGLPGDSGLIEHTLELLQD